MQIGQNKQPVQIMELVSITKPAWQKKTCFRNLASQAYNLALGDHSVAVILTFVMDKMPTCTLLAFQETKHVGRIVEKSLLHINNLYLLALLDSKDDELNVNVTAGNS